MDKQRLTELAGIIVEAEKIDTDGLASQIYTMAEKIAYDKMAPNKQAVTGDMIAKYIKEITSNIEKLALKQIEQKHM